MIKLIVRIGLLMSVMMALHGVVAETVAERLGYQADDVLLIIHADDMGMCRSANEACMECLDKGIVTSASVMVPCPWFPEAAQYFRENPDADMGLHLTLTAEWKKYRWGPVAPKSDVPGLLDPDGYFFHGVRSVVQSAKADEVEKEIRAQIEHAIKNGMKPTHMDSHMGTVYAHPAFWQAALKLSEEYNIPFMNFSASKWMLERAKRDGIQFPVEAANALAARGIPLIDSLPAIDDVPLEQTEEAYRELIANLEPGVHLLIIHPNVLTEESKAITGTHMKRNEEYKIFTNPETKKFIDEHNVKLIGWKDLQPLWNARKK
ncbi:MAG: polysaccharide deacetylase family protein [Candidatus Hinthialibacter antarcticus]|nr:polysaccharide deacetylase family protein [Candidatus Hinthialibacter antarcticus]